MEMALLRLLPIDVRGGGLGRLYDAVCRIDATIEQRGLDAFKTKGEIGVKAGFFLAIVTPSTPDDPERIARLSAAMQQVLGITAD